MRILLALVGLSVACGPGVTCEQACQPFIDKMAQCCAYTIQKDKRRVPTAAEWCTVGGVETARDNCLKRADWDCHQVATWLADPSATPPEMCCESDTFCW
jgi:hypothetical protein